MHPKNLSIADFFYILPPERIAKYPLAERDSSKLLLYRNKKIEETTYKNIDQWLASDSILICNNTKVIAARLLFQKPTGAIIEIFCLEPHPQYGDISAAMRQKESVLWLCMIGGASKWKAGQVLHKKTKMADKEFVVEAQFIGKEESHFAVKISWKPHELSFAEILRISGTIPLPPYLKREAESSDEERYQTMYANAEGSVAAPTAGLHFTETIFENLEHKKIFTKYVTLHVGAGTFKPVKAEKMEDHEMHAEFLDVDYLTIESILNNKGSAIAVGTTSLRTIESLYWMGVKTILTKNISLENLQVGQWEPYELSTKQISTSQALQGLLQWMINNKMTRLLTKTQILIAPGYEFKIADVLVTNFHQPQSTLLLLVAAFAGEDWKKIYEYALDHQYRFLSYGDGCLLFRH